MEGSFVKYLKQYTIPFSGLSEGKHDFNFNVDDRFFAEFEETEVEKGDVNVQVSLEKRTTHLVLNFEIEGEVQVVCDRCLEPYAQPVEGDSTIYVKFSEEEQEGDDEVIYLHPTEHQVEIGQLIYEFIVLNLPVRRIHPDDENGNSSCDAEMLQRLSEFDNPGDDGDDEPTDPRWNDLKKIIGN